MQSSVGTMAEIDKSVELMALLRLQNAEISAELNNPVHEVAVEERLPDTSFGIVHYGTSDNPIRSTYHTPLKLWLNQQLFDLFQKREHLVNRTEATEQDPSFLFNELIDALIDLHELKNEALEEGIPPPSELAMTNSNRLVQEIYSISPSKFLVELLPDSSIAITVPGPFRSSVMLVCESFGEVLCSVNLSGQHRRERYSQADSLPDIFLRKALAELKQRDSG